MPPPTRFHSVKTGDSRPVARKRTFRDDCSLVGFRYDKTVAAEPPVHVLRSTSTGGSPRPRPPLPLLQRSPSSSTTTTRASSSSYSYAASISAVSLAGTAATSIHHGVSTSGGPVVVAPPPPRLMMNLPASIAPPMEQHPALRSPLPALDEWKRDSAHSGSIVSKTIPEEERLNVAEFSADDDCFVEKKRPASPVGQNRPVSTAGAAIPGNNIPRCQSLIINGLRPAISRAASVSASTNAAPPKNSAWTTTTTTKTATNGSPVLATTTAGAASRTLSSSVIAPLDLRIPSFTASSSTSPSSSSSYTHHPAFAAAITASDFLPAPVSPPPSPPARASSHRKLFRRQSMRLSSIWGGARDDAAAAAARPQQHQDHHLPQRQSSPRAPRRSHSVSQLRGGSTAVDNTRPSTSAPGVAGITDITGITGNSAIAGRRTGGPSPGTATPAPASAKLQPPLSLSPARSSPRSPPTMSPPPDTGRESLADFSPLGIAIPTDSLLDDDFISSLNFSKRGSLMLDLDNAGAMDRMSLTDDDRSATPTQLSSVDAPPAPGPTSSATSCAVADDHVAEPTSVASPTADDHVPELTSVASPTTDVRAMAPDVEQESQKVRQLYASWEPPARHSYCDRLEPTPEVLTEDDESVANGNTLVSASSVSRSVSSSSQSNDVPARKELADPAGGFEDWDDLDSAMVDRYGFIGTPRSQSRVGTPTEMRSIHHSPRRRKVLTKRDPMGFTSSQSGMRLPSRKVSARSLNTQHSEVSIVSFRSSRSVIRQAGNLLPQNRNRRWMDEAGDMLTVSPNLQDSVEEARVEKISEALKRKEIDRSEKWRRMARVTRKGEHGQGMEFEFDTKNPKLIDRTWKGIPDRWRAAAWWSFLATSAKEHPGSATDDEITAAFCRLQHCASADDIQIDLDVPRTISRHIMFRRRYRGGQRLLFRVLHALSLYFPETGYVQGMASLAATLLCYFDEEKCFVMLVRMWQLRGLERLYQPGFDGLLAALREFETTWLHKDVARKTLDLGIDGTAYGTRWYLTLFNLSIPFAAQLRVWDVFLLLGDAAKGDLPVADDNTAAPKPSDGPLLPPINEDPMAATAKATTTTTTPSSGLDVLHATSAALIQALREVLLDSDFENAMKALTAWIPVKDEDLLMKVTRAEWKTQLKKRS